MIHTQWREGDVVGELDSAHQDVWLGSRILARGSAFPACACRVRRQPIHQAQSLVPQALKLLLQPLAVTLQLGHCACQPLRPVQSLEHPRLHATLPLLHIVLARLQ